jgi:hypothetical protein
MKKYKIQTDGSAVEVFLHKKRSGTHQRQWIMLCRQGHNSGKCQKTLNVAERGVRANQMDGFTYNKKVQTLALIG